MTDILFTCAGTTDPVRGGYDGGVLHIMRHYRPKKVYLFLSAEMVQYERKDQRFEKMFQYVRDEWSYAPETCIEYSDIDNVADLDVVNEPLRSFFYRAADENPGCRILVNLSSGTPQMKIVLAQLALSTRYKAVGIQVSNPERRAGNSVRNNRADYEAELELLYNEDDKPDAPNRCSEPRMMAMHRDRQHAQIRSLLKRRDYQALETMCDELPEELRQLVKHLVARSDLQISRADTIARNLKLPFRLRPTRRVADESYRLLSEYYLLLRNLQLTQRYTEFVLRINPFLTQLVLRLVERKLPCALSEITDSRTDGRCCLNPYAMEQRIPDVKRALEREMGALLEPNKDFSLYVGVPLLRVLNGLTPDLLNLLDGCVSLNREQRNPAAHRLHSVTEEQIRSDCVDQTGKHYGSHELVEAFQRMIQAAYPQDYDGTLFRVYDQCEAYFLGRL